MSFTTYPHTHLAHQFDTLPQQALTAKLGMWAFLATEVLFFGGAFAGYAVYRARFPIAWTEASRHLDLVAGTVNTAVLLCSSLTMAFAVDAARRERHQETFWQLLATLLLGFLFLGIKGWEYYDKLLHHLVPGDHFQWPDTAHAHAAELFYGFYFSLTGIHALHMVIGAGLLITLMVQVRQQQFSSTYFTPVEITGLYWHFVDCVWVMLFPLLYLIDRA